MLKDVFCKIKTKTIDGTQKRYKVARTTGETTSEIGQKIGLMPTTIDTWLQNERRSSWKLEDEIPFTTILKLAELLQVPTADLLSQGGADRYRQQERKHPSVTIAPVAKPDVTMEKTARYLTPQQIGERMGISAKTVIRYIQAGELPAVHLGRRYVVEVSDAEAWISSRSTV
jgi:excisionase family DNA binding protein